ncbi:unnamed protein product [Knipowitschia caucasica]
MVRNVDDLDFCLASHPQSILEGLRSLCSHPKLIDVTLVAGGRDFPCHRGVLALCSPYFRCMFSGDFVESIAARVELHEVDPNILGHLLDFAYTGKLTINQSNVEGLICTSSQLQFQTVRSVCSRYLQHQIDATNCLGILEFGEIHGCPEVVAKAWAFLLENFEAVQRGEEFLTLTKDKLTKCLSNDGLQIRLSLLSADYLNDNMLKEGLVQESPICREAVENILREKMSLVPELTDRSSCCSPQQNLQEVLFVMGGRALDDSDDEEDSDSDDRDPRLERLPPKNCAFYNTKTKQWHQLPNFPNPNKWGYSMVSLNNDVYVSGGSRGSNTNTWSTTETWKYVTKEAKWITVAPMQRPRTNHTSATLNGEIYVIGGTTSDRVEVEHYDPYSDSWALTCPALKYVTNFTASACQGKLYVIGSCAVKYNALTMQCYNPVIDSWIHVCSPFIPKYLSSPRSVCMDGVIYLVADNTKKVYSYDPEANMWQKVQLLQMLHENGGLVALSGKIYVTGGHWKGMEGDYGVEMEVYSRASNSWDIEGTLPRMWFYTGLSTIFLDPSQWPDVYPAEAT